MRRSRLLLIAIALLLGSTPVRAGFASLEQYLAAVGRVTGAGGAEFYTTIWVTNLTSAPASFTFEFLKQGQANTSPASFTDSLAPGQTKVYENVVQAKLGLSDALGGARVTSTGELLIAERIYNQPPGADLGESEGLFFAGVPRSFSISLGQSASIQGINQGGAEDFRYNFALLETGGGSPTVNVQLFDGNGTMLGQKAYPMQPYEQLQPNVKDLFAGVATTNARITATVTGGTGSAIIAGAQLANTSQDSSGFEMSFRDQLLGSGGAAGVTMLNGLTGALTIAHGANTTVNVNGSTITIDAVSGSGKGLSAVAHDNSLAGSGTVAVPLGIAPGSVGNVQLGAGAVTAPKIAAGQVVTSVNGLHDGVTFAGSSSVTITPSGNTLTFSATGGGGSGVSSLNGETGALTLAGAGSVSVTPSGNTITITGSGGGGGGGLTLPYGSSFSSGTGFAVHNTGSTGTSIEGDADPGSNGDGVHGLAVGTGIGVKGSSNGGVGVYGGSSATYGIEGVTTAGNAGAAGVYGKTTGNWAGVQGDNANGNEGFLGGGDYGVFGTSATNPGMVGKTSASTGGVWGHNNTSGDDGYLGGPDYGVFGTSAATNTPGVIGVNSNSGSGWGVQGENTVHGNNGYLGGATYGVYGTSASNLAVYGTCSTNQCVAIRGIGFGTGYSMILDGQAAINGAVVVNGNFSVAGSKSFVAPHPTDPGKEIRFVCLEGPESGTYFRGTGKIVGGFAEIAIPESFRLSTSSDGLTVVATPVGDLAVLAAVRVGLDKIVIRGSSDVAFSYIVNGVRKGFENFQAVAENTHFIPRSPSDPGFGAGLNDEAVRRLKANGVLNADGSINLETARRLGWDRQPGWDPSTR